MKYKLSLLIVLLLCLSACAGLAQRKKVERFEEALKQYNIALRWGMYPELKEFHMHRDSSRPETDIDSLKLIRITGYQVLKREMSDDLSEATVTSEYSYYHNEYGIVKKATLTHSWWYEEESKHWFNESEFPVFK